MYTFQALQVLVFLIPGFISATILNVLIVRKAKSELGKIVEALIFSLIIYTIYSLVVDKSPVALIQVGESSTYSYDSEAFLWLGLFSIVIPLVLAFLVTNDLHMKLSRFFRISRRTARSSVWFDVFADQKKHVIIDFADGRRIYGWPMYYSDNPEDQYVFLYDPAWIEQDDATGESKFIDVDIEGILITPEQSIESIMFLKD